MINGCKTVIVLDHSRCTVHIFYFPNDWNIDEEYIVNELGFKESNISWMVGKEIPVLIGENEKFGGYL